METTMPVLGMVAGRAQRDRSESFRDHNRKVFDGQRRGRRGPTPEVFFTKHIDNSRIRKLEDPERRREMRSFTIAMSVLFLAVMSFVGQHFFAIEMGYSIESSKAEVQRLREENQHLRLTEAQLSDPQRIDSIARRMGMDTPQPGQVVRPEGAASNSQPVLAAVTQPVLP